MALHIFENGLPSTISFSHDNTFSNPVVWQANAVDSTVIEKRLIIRQAIPDYTVMYTDVVVKATDTTATGKETWFLFATETSGVPDTYSNFIDISALAGGDTVPFWIKLTAPSALIEQTIHVVKFVLNYREHVS